MKINELHAVLHGGAKTNKFRVIINVPFLAKVSSTLTEVVGGGPTLVNQDTLDILTKETSIPSKEITTINIWHRGREYPIRGKADFTHSWDVTFYNDRTLNVRGFFEDWMYQIDRYDSMMLETMYTANYLGAGSFNLGYMTSIGLKQLDADGTTVTAEYEILRAFPIKISEQKYDAGELHQISSFTVTFSYDYWIRKKDLGVFSGVDTFLSNFT